MTNDNSSVQRTCKDITSPMEEEKRQSTDSQRAEKRKNVFVSATALLYRFETIRSKRNQSETRTKVITSLRGIPISLH